MNHRLLFLVLVAHGQAMPGPKKAQSVICHAVISSLMYGMLKHILLSSLCKNNYLGVGIPVYTCLSKRACHFTHNFRFSHIQHTFVSFSGQSSRLPRGQPSSRHSSLSQQKRRRREERGERKERREKKGEENKMRQSISSRLPLHTYIGVLANAGNSRLCLFVREG